jgi:hypothetical protein
MYYLFKIPLFLEFVIILLKKKKEKVEEIEGKKKWSIKWIRIGRKVFRALTKFT